MTGDSGANDNLFSLEISRIRNVLPDEQWLEYMAVNTDFLTRRLETERPAVLHICAHVSEGQLALRGHGGVDWIDFENFAEAIRLKPPPRILMLSMCAAQPLAELLRDWAVTTVYWGEEIDDSVAGAFSPTFYSQMLAGMSVSHAIMAACATSVLMGRVPRVIGNEDLVLVPSL